MERWSGPQEPLPEFQVLAAPALFPEPQGPRALAATSGSRLMLATAAVRGAHAGSALDPFATSGAKAGEVLGHVRVALDLAPAEQALRHSVLVSLGFALLVIGLGAALALLVHRNLLVPIVRLTRVADQVASGDLPPGAEETLRRTEGDGEDEVAQLARAFERMVSRLALTLHGIGDAVMVLDGDGRLLLANPAAARMAGTTREALVGRKLSDALELTDPGGACLGTELQEALLDSEETGTWQRRGQLGGPEGLPVDARAFPTSPIGSERRGAILVLRDIAAQAHLEEERLRASKLESVGVLAGGIAHDFNNLLTTILGNVGFALEQAPPDTPLAEALADADRALVRAQQLTQRLLTFARGGLPLRAPHRLEGLVEESLALALSGSNCTSQVDLAPDLPAVLADAGQLGQVLRNLILHASQAMESGGTVRVVAEPEEVAPDSPLPLEAGTYVRVDVTDEGRGIAPELLEKVFDPYFTTKSRGSGLGLATAFSIMRNHEGHLAARSQLGEGSTFSLWLPTSRAAPTPEPSPRPAPREGGARVLVVDDEPDILRLAARLLGSRGYRVEGVEEGQAGVEAYRAAREAGEPFDVVVLDLTIPGGMGGKETIQRLREEDPEVRAVVTSGYSNDPVMAEYRAYGFQARVAKPFRVAELLRALEEAIATPTSG